MNLVVFTEEPSMKVLLDVVLPKVVQEPHSYRVISHSGISDLKKSLPNKLSTWKSPDTKFLILVDQDAADCKIRKTEFESICQKFKPANDYSVRIVCQELEAWFLGDAQAVLSSNLPGRTKLGPYVNKDLCNFPDKVPKPSRRLDEILGGYQKISGAKAISGNLDLEKNNSKSFAVFLEKIREFCM